ncbi:hypothetical protein CCMA1212_000646 [Trichoderma ghanense]|uniref:N-acetyltransferase ESCO zinc-finger domain-containing protein n=1 Tax=Trichoderma ghanense TaxID=65468 RepID=A0ABY2HIM2_9HYPO
MVNSSPEYSITKPGLHHLRKRDKPLRTYGRQPSTPEAQSGPPLKRRRLSALKNQQQDQQEEEAISTPDSSNDAPEPEATPSASSETRSDLDDAANQTKPDTKRTSSSKGSILSYFKPAPAPPKPKDETPPPPQESQPQPEDEPSALPESPPKRKQSSRRKPRLLKIKPVTHEPLDEPQESDETPSEQEHETDLQSRPPLRTTTSNATKASVPDAPSTSTSPRKTSLRNHQKPSGQSSSSSPTVQTTLNISAKAAFSECKICDTVWNPLYPDDVKFHDKAHKAVLRAQRKRRMDEL